MANKISPKTRPKSLNKAKSAARPVQTARSSMDKVDKMVKEAGEADKGEPHLDLCPKCGSGDIGIRRIDIPGFLPEVQVCNKCGFRSKSVLEIEPIEYVEDVGDEEEDMVSRLAEIEKRVQSGQYTAAEGKKRSKAARQGKAPGQRANAKFFAKTQPKPKPKSKPASKQAKKPKPMKKKR